MLITLPFEMEIEQIEIPITNTDIFNKYLKLLKVDKHNDDQQPLLMLKSGIQDNIKK